MDSLSACLPGTFGKNCNQVCQCSETNQLCHPVSGLCYCAPGFTGPKCDQGMSAHTYTVTWTNPWSLVNPVTLGCLFSVCAQGLYGPNCERVCKCENGGKCTPSTGACECPAGFIGACCSISECVWWWWRITGVSVTARGDTRLVCVLDLPACPPGRYGADCARVALCGDRALNDPVTGQCVCVPGRRGDDCGHSESSVLLIYFCGVFNSSFFSFLLE